MKVSYSYMTPALVPLKWAKMAVLELLNSPKLISRKI